METFTEIGQFRSVVKQVRQYYDRIQSPHLIPTLTFVGTSKLHGTNGGLRRKNGKIQPQSRNNIISVENDNCGFAKFISGIPESVLNELFDTISSNPDDEITLYGEWAGKGIQSGVGVAELDRFWALFAARKNGMMVPSVDGLDAPAHRIFNVADAGFFKVKVDFKNPEAAIVEFERRTMDVENECPFAKVHGVSGIGEGIVWRCVERPSDTDLWFKTKGTKHSNSKVKKVATVDIEKVNGINACVDLVLPQGRLDQGFDYFRENQIDIDPKNMGQYLKWISGDVLKEETDTIQGNGFEWKDVQKVITVRAREYFFKKYNESI